MNNLGIAPKNNSYAIAPFTSSIRNDRNSAKSLGGSPNDKKGVLSEEQGKAIRGEPEKVTLVSRDANGTFNIKFAAGASSVDIETRANQIASGIRLNGGVGEYFAIGIDVPDALTAGFSQLMGLVLRKLGVPPKAIAGVEKMFVNFAAKGKSLGGSIGTVPRLEFNCSMLPDLKAQEASGNFHIKFSPVSYPEIQSQIVTYKAMLSAIPGSEIAVDVLSKLQAQIDRTGKLKQGTSPFLSAVYASIVSDANVPPPVAGPQEAPKKYNQAKLGLFDTRISFNWYKAFVSNKGPDIRLGRMYVALGNPEKLNDSLLGSDRRLSYIKLLGAPYVSPRLGLDGSVQLVFGFGGLALGSSNSLKPVQTNKAFIFPGFYIAAKLSFGENNTFVRVDANTVAVRMNINGSTVLVTVPPALFKTIETLIVGGDRQLKLAPLKAGEKVLDVNGVIAEFLVDHLDPEIIKFGGEIAEKSEEIAEAISTPVVRDAITLLTGIMGFRAGPYVGTATTATSLFEIITSRYERAFEDFYDAFTKRLSSGTSPPTLFADMTQTIELIIKAYESAPRNRFGSGGPSVGQLRAALAKVMIFYDAAIKKASEEGTLPGGMVGFYKELQTAANSNDLGSLQTLVAKKFLGLSTPATTDEQRDGKSIVLNTLIQPRGKEFFPLFQLIDGLTNARPKELSDSHVAKIMATENPKVVREMVDYYVSKGGDPQRLVAQLGFSWRQLVNEGKNTPILFDTYSSAISSPATGAWVRLNNAIFSGDVAKLSNQNKLFDFSVVDGSQNLKTPAAIADYIRRISGDLLSLAELRNEQIRAKNPAYAGKALDPYIAIEGGITVPASFLKYWDAIAFALVVGLGVDSNFGIPFLAQRIANLKNAINGKKHFQLSPDVLKQIPAAKTQFGGNWQPSPDYKIIKKAFNPN